MFQLLLRKASKSTRKNPLVVRHKVPTLSYTMISLTVYKAEFLYLFCV